MNFSYENQGHNTFLVYSLSEGESVDTLSLGMLNNNNIYGFLDPVFIQMDLDRFIKYNVSGKISVKQAFMGAVNRKKLINLFRSVVDALLTAEEYMIDTATVLLDLEYIFIDVSNSQMSLVILPVVGSDYKQMPVETFFKQIMFGTQFDQSENGDYVAKIINHLNGTTVFSLELFKDLLDTLDKESMTAPAIPPMAPPAAVPNIQQQSMSAPAPMPAAAPAPMQMPMPVRNSINAAVTMPPVKKDTPPAPVQIPEKKPEVSEIIRNNLTSGSYDDAAKTDEKPISLMYLLQHFSSDNLEAYKRQKNEAKSKKEEAQAAAPADLGFAIPGQKPTLSDIKLDGSPQQEPKPVKSGIPFLKKSSASNVAPAPMQNAAPMQNVVSVPPVPMQTPVQSAPAFSDQADFGETCYYDDEANESTVMLGMTEEAAVRPHLVRKNGNISIPIGKEIFRIGRNSDFNDYVVTDNKFVGHAHCHIVVRNEEYYVVDDNSKNHTFIDGTMITPGQEYKLSHGQTLKLANEEFEFKLY